MVGYWNARDTMKYVTEKSYRKVQLFSFLNSPVAISICFLCFTLLHFLHGRGRWTSRSSWKVQTLPGRWCERWRQCAWSATEIWRSTIANSLNYYWPRSSGSRGGSRKLNAGDVTCLARCRHFVVEVMVSGAIKHKHQSVGIIDVNSSAHSTRLKFSFRFNRQFNIWKAQREN